MADRRPAHRNLRATSNPYSRPAPPGSWKHDKASQDIPTARALPNVSDTDTIVISNLHYEVSTEDLISIFESVGTLGRAPAIKYDRSGRSLGVAYVHFADPKDAQVAQARLNGVPAKGQPMSIIVEQGRKGFIGKSGPKASLLTRIASVPLASRVSAAISADPGFTTKAEPTKSQRERRQKPAAAAAKKPSVAHAAKLPKTAEELDRELEAYLDKPSAANDGVSSAAPAAGGDKTVIVEDIDMS